MYMSNQFLEIETSALKLNSKDRARLASRLLRSLEKRGDARIEQAWTEVAIRRKKEVESGTVNRVGVDDVLENARKLVSG